MPRLAMAVAYLGAKYHGWQVQSQIVTLQSVVELAISKVANANINTVCTGRTDTGVHALMQVVHFDSSATRTEVNWLLGVNANLPDDIRVVWVRQVKPEFHARVSAIARKYVFLLDNGKVKNLLLDNKALYYKRYLDVSLMHNAINSLIGEHDFSAFRAAGCQSLSPMRNVDFAKVIRLGDLVVISIRANAFLYHMVRNIVGSLLLVGTQARSLAWFSDLLVNKNRNLAGKTIAPHGLYLYQVTYASEFGLPEFGQKFSILGIDDYV